MPISTATSRRNKKNNGALLRLLLLAAILIAANMLAVRFHARLDLTAEKRFTLSPATKRLLAGMNDAAVVEVYLKGNFPAGFQRLAEATRERLQSFKDVAGNRIIFRFTDPFEGKSEAEKGDVFKNLEQKGILGVNIKQDDEEGYSEKIVFPYALIRYKGREASVRLLEEHMGMGPLEKLNYSESLLEYKLANALHHLESPAKPRLAWVMGNGESLGPQTFDIITSLGNNYTVDTIDLNQGYFLPVIYDAVIICKPVLAFDEKEKFKIDQYVMKGGHVLWLLDALQASMDSLGNEAQSFMATPYELNLDDQLFRYGVRLNNDLVEDLHCLEIPVTVGMLASNRPDIQLRKWQYFPLLSSSGQHPIVNNLDDVVSLFAGTLDTAAGDGIRKTVLLQTSKYSRAAPAPVRVSLSMLRFAPRPELYSKSYRPAALLLEGSFQSVFKNRIAGDFARILADSLHLPFKESGPRNGRMIVVADGDVAENDYNAQQPFEMGYWRYTGAAYANKNFIYNCLEYLTDSSTLLEARSKDQRLRQLDSGRVKAEKTKWQAVNIVLPLLAVGLFGSAYTFFRRRRYAMPAGAAHKSA